jgi:hypothetical protein
MKPTTARSRFLKRLLFLPLIAIAVAIGSAGPGVDMASAARCADFPNQAAAQAAANTRDADGDGIYCESLPCPCGTAAGGGAASPTPVAPDPSAGSEPSTQPAGCTSPSTVQPVVFSATKYPNIMRHFRAAVRKGWPRVLTINRSDADQRRDRLLRGIPTRSGFDRDEYPPAVGRGAGGAERGTDPAGWMASVQYVRSSENRSHGSKLGSALRRFCDGVRFRYVFE